METMKDLFGHEITVEEYLRDPDKKEPNHESVYQKFKRENNYIDGRTADGLSIYQRCKYCIHHICGKYHNKTYHKCELLGLSHSEATDIRVNYVCDKFYPDQQTAKLVDSGIEIKDLIEKQMKAGVRKEKEDA